MELNKRKSLIVILVGLTFLLVMMSYFSGAEVGRILENVSFNLSRDIASRGGGFVVSSTDGRFTNGTSLRADFFGSNGLSVVNLSGIININASFFRNASHGGDLVNVTFGWLLAKNNGSTMLNTTVFNSTANQTSFNYSFNTNLLPDGIYNISVFVQNISVDDPFSRDIIVNYSLGFDIAIDRTPPNVTQFLINGSDLSDTTGISNLNFSNWTNGGVLEFNLTVNDTTLTTETVRIGLQNNLRNVSEFNITLSKNQGVYRAVMNLNTLTDGLYSLFVYANDTLNNFNNSVANLSFRIDRTPPNVTVVTWNNFTEIFNLTSDLATGIVHLNTTVNDTTTTVTSVIFGINSTNGTQFNVTASKSFALGRWNASINLTLLTEGTHTIIVYANDTLLNQNNTERTTIMIDRTAPTVTVTCDPSSATAGQTVTCTCTATEPTSMSGVRTVDFVGSGGKTSESTTATGSGSFTSSTCTAEDFTGNRKSATGSWTVTAAVSGGGGGGAGGGGGVGAGIVGVFEKKVWTSINAGETATVPVRNSVLGVTEVSFAVEEATYGAWVEIQKVDSLPSNVERYAGAVYKTLQISERNVEKALKGTATISFKVEKTWLTDNKLSPEEVALHRYSDGQWKELATTKASEDDSYVYYTAQTPGFSYFVIAKKIGAVPAVVKKPAEVVQVPAVEAPVEAPAEVPVEEAVPVEKPGRGKAAWLVPLIILIVVLGLLYWYWGRKR